MALLAVCFMPAKPVAFAADPTPDRQFAERLTAYQQVRKEAAKDLPALGDKASPEQVRVRRVLLQKRMRVLRTDAKPGDVLTPALWVIISAVRSQTEGAQGDSTKTVVLGEGNPAEEGSEPKLRVNEPYPQDAPLSTVPPGLLAQLPELPDGLEYRFVGNNLILYDVEADIVADFIRQVVE